MEKIKIKRIKSVSISKKEDVYDITTKKNHNFFGNNTLVKNCGEVILNEGSQCLLLSVNLLGFVKFPFETNAIFDFDSFKKYVYKAQRLIDDMVDLELEKLSKIIEKVKSDPEDDNVKREELELWELIKRKCIQGRRTGLGITALGDTIAALNVRYGSKESIEITEEIYKALTTIAYKSSIDLAQERGSFELFNYEKEKKHNYLNRVISSLGEEYIEKWKKYGRRNIAITTTAPTGTVSIMTQTTSGIEPCFMPVYKRRKKVQTEKDRVDFVDDNGDKWTEFEVCHHQFSKWREITGKTNVEDSPYYKATSNDVDWMASVEMQARAQKWVCHSISKTCFTKDTIIETDKGLVYFDELLIEELPNVRTHTGNYKEMTSIINNGIKDVYLVTFDNGIKLKITNNHKLRVKTKFNEIIWKELKDILDTDVVITN